MASKCAITGCESKWTCSDDVNQIPMFSMPKNFEIKNKWLINIDSQEVNRKLMEGSMICIKHFENKFINADKSIVQQAIPTLHLKRGNTLVDFEELLAHRPPMKKKRGTSGLMNLQIARKKKLMRRERMQKLAEKRRLAKLENGTTTKVQNKKKIDIMDSERNIDYFLGDRNESKTEKVIISLRLINLMQHLHDEKAFLCKHPSSIRDSKTYPMFNKIKNIQQLIDNPVLWNREQTLAFIEHLCPDKRVLKKFEMEEIDGEAIVNMTKFDLVEFLQLEPSISEILSTAFVQLRKETIMRYVNS